MDTLHSKLYERLGFSPDRIAAAAAPTGVALESVAGVAEETVVAPLGLPDLAEIESAYAQDPEGTLAWFRGAWDPTITEDELVEALASARHALEEPESAVVSLEAVSAHLEAATPLPVDFTFDGIDLLDRNLITPASTKFETRRDALGWMIHAGPFFLADKMGGIKKDPYRRHDAQHPYVYPLPDAVLGDVAVALFSDFGTGEYHSRYIAAQIERRRPAVAIHLGDVYYAGQPEEQRRHFDAPLAPLLASTSLYALNANHEMLAGAKPYFKAMDARRSARANQLQQGSYFCLRSAGVQIIGIDTAYFGAGRVPDPASRAWLRTVLAEGRASGASNILLSSDQPYEYGKAGTTDLIKHDLGEVAGLVDLWFWGNTHYAALFDRAPALPFIGSCVGHGGYPYTRKTRSSEKDAMTPAPVRWLEEGARFPDPVNLRPTRGSNGFCMLRVRAGGTIELEYIDWMNASRHSAKLARDGAGALRFVP